MIYRISIILYRYKYRIEKNDRYPALIDSTILFFLKKVNQIAIFCSFTARIAKHGNPADRFSHDTTHLLLSVYFQMTQNGTDEIDEATLLQDPDYKALVDYGINKVVAAELKKIYESGLWSQNINCDGDLCTV